MHNPTIELPLPDILEAPGTAGDKTGCVCKSREYFKHLVAQWGC